MNSQLTTNGLVGIVGGIARVSGAGLPLFGALHCSVSLDPAKITERLLKSSFEVRMGKYFTAWLEHQQTKAIVTLSRRALCNRPTNVT